MNAPALSPRLPAEIDLQVVEVYPYIEYIKYLLSGSISMAIFVVAMIGGGIVFIDDKARGLHEGYLVTPIRKSELILGLNVAGVDMLRSKRGPVVLEVNSSPGLEGIEEATGVDVPANEVPAWSAVDEKEGCQVVGAPRCLLEPAKNGDKTAVEGYEVRVWSNPHPTDPRRFRATSIPAEIKAARAKPLKPTEVAAMRATMIPPVARAETAPAQVTLPVAFTADQAARGRRAYEGACIDCHGSELNNGEFGGAPLTGSWFRNKWGNGNLAAFFAYTKTRMPPDRPGTFNDQTYSELVAYILSIDNIVPKDAVLDASSLPKVQMPNRAGFVNWEPRLIKP